MGKGIILATVTEAYSRSHGAGGILTVASCPGRTYAGAMLLVVAVVVGGILLGLAFGGSFRNLGEVHLRWWPLALTGLILQLIPVPSRPGQADHWAAVGLFAASYVVLL